MAISGAFRGPCPLVNLTNIASRQPDRVPSPWLLICGLRYKFLGERIIMILLPVFYTGQWR